MDMEATKTGPRSMNINVQCTKHNVLVPEVSLSHRFVGTRMHYHGFLNQIKLFIWQPQRYSNYFCWDGLLGTNHSDPIKSLFTILVETPSPLLQKFDAFLLEFECPYKALFVTSAYMCRVSVYVFKFWQLGYDGQWGGQALCQHFFWGLWSEIKNFLLTI